MHSPYQSRIVTSAVVPLSTPSLLSYLIVCCLIPLPTHPHPAQHTCCHSSQQPRCEHQNPEVLPWFRRVHTAGTLYNICTLAPGAGCPSPTACTDYLQQFWGLLALFIMTTNELNENYHTIIQSMMPVFPRPTHEPFPFFPDYFVLGETSGCLYQCLSQDLL